MNAAIEFIPALNGIPYFGSTKVIEYDVHNRIVKVKIHLMGSVREVQARVAVQHSTPLGVDDEVLVVVPGNGQFHHLEVVEGARDDR